MSGHDPATGKEYWRADVLNPDHRIPDDRRRPDHRAVSQHPAVALHARGSSDVAATHVAWTFPQGPYVPTPVSDGKLLYVVRDGGVVFALDVKTGETVYGPVRLSAGPYSASPILADGKIYVTALHPHLVLPLGNRGPEGEEIDLRHDLAASQLIADVLHYAWLSHGVRPPFRGPLFLWYSQWRCAIHHCDSHRSDWMADEKLDLLKGTLDLLVLQILSSMGPLHGYGIARRLEQVSGDQLAMNEGTIYASLVRLQHRRLIKTAWGTSENNRRAKFYSLTRAGEKALAAEAANWERLASVIGRVLTTSRGGIA